MILSFDKFERYELPQVTLCNPNSRATEVDGKITITDTVGVLSNPKGMNLKLNFNAPHELSFDYYRHKSNDPIKQSFYDKIYESIQTDRYIYLTDIGYFVISSVTDSDEDNIDKKSITCKSCEDNELATAEGLHLKEGTYYLHTENNDGLLDLFLPKTAGWTMGYIDPSLLTKPYFVEDTEVDNGYNFLYTTIQDMFECIVEPNIIKRTISVYSRVYYAEHHLTDIHIVKYNLLKHKTVEENDEDKYTALNVQGKDENLEIRTVNPTGKNVIYNFEPRYAWMSPALQDAVERWQDKCESVEEEYLTLQQGYYNDMQNIVFPLEQDIKVLELQLKQQQQTRDLIVIGEQDKAIKVVEVLPETGKSNILYFVPTTVNNYEEYVWENNSWKYIDLIQVDDISDTNQQRALDLVNAAINNTNIALSEKQSMLEDEKNKIQTNYSERIDQINSECALETTDIFTTELRNELMTHIKPTDYIDEYMLVTESMTYPQKFEKAKELMNRAQSQLVKISSGQKTYSIDTRSFLFNKQFKHFSEQLCAGAIIYVETKNDIIEQLHLSGIDINFDEKSTNFTLGNKYNRSDLKALYEDALGKNSKSFSELKYIASIIEDQQKQLDYQKNWVADLRTLTLDNVLTSEDQAIEINNRGLIGRKRRLDANGNWDFDENGNPYFEEEQVKLIHNSLIFTKDNWKHAEAAIGKIAVGYNADGSVKYDYGMNGRVIIGELFLGNNLVLTGTGAGIKIKDSNGNDAFYADDDGNLVLSGTINAKNGDIAGWLIEPSRIYNINKETNYEFSLWNPGIAEGTIISCQNLTDLSYPFYVTREGSLNAKKGNIGGWNLEYGALYSKDTSNRYCGMGLNGYKYAFFAGGANSDGSDGLFRVNHSGHLYAKNAEIDGKVTADQGKIGGWELANWCLKSTTSQWEVFVRPPKAYGNSGGDTDVIVVHDLVKSAYPFVVKSDGTLRCTKAEITGTINAETITATKSGTVAGWSINSATGFKSGNSAINANGTMALYPQVGSGGTILFNNGARISVTAGVAISSNANGGVTATSSNLDLKACSGSKAYLGCMLNSDGTTERASVTCSNGVLRLYSYDRIDVIGTNGSGSTDISDKNRKNSISTLEDNYNILFDSLLPIKYKYNEGTSNRYHTGFIAQSVGEALEKAELSTQDFAGLTIQNPNTEDELWGLRYSEFIALNTWQIQRCKKRIADLETTVAELKTQIQTLTAG